MLNLLKCTCSLVLHCIYCFVDHQVSSDVEWPEIVLIIVCIFEV